jgi:hypothetical protein
MNWHNVWTLRGPGWEGIAEAPSGQKRMPRFTSIPGVLLAAEAYEVRTAEAREQAF